jgi:hypothetical protein
VAERRRVGDAGSRFCGLRLHRGARRATPPPSRESVRL